MKRLSASPSLRPLLPSALLAILLMPCGPAAAQYLWIDEHGIKQLSDRPPPPEVTAKRILKSPARPSASTRAPQLTTVELASEPAPTLAEREADFRRRQDQARQAEQKASAQAAQQADLRANCSAARDHQRALDQGIRLAGYTAAGEPTVLNDDERADMARKNRQILARCK